MRISSTNLYDEIRGPTVVSYSLEHRPTPSLVWACGVTIPHLERQDTSLWDLIVHISG